MIIGIGFVLFRAHFGDTVGKVVSKQLFSADAVWNETGKQEKEHKMRSDDGKQKYVDSVPHANVCILSLGLKTDLFSYSLSVSTHTLLWQPHLLSMLSTTQSKLEMHGCATRAPLPGRAHVTHIYSYM